MVVYIEAVFIENALIDWLLLALCGRITYKPCVHPFYSAALGAVFACVMPLWEGLNSIWFKLITLLLITIICFMPKNIKELLRQCAAVVGVFGALYGVITFASFKLVKYGFFYSGSGLMIVSLLSLFCAVAACKISTHIADTKRIAADTYELTLYGRTLNAFADSGNSLYYNNIPVVLVNSSELRENMPVKPLIIPYSGVGKNGALLGFQTDEAVVSSGKGSKKVKCVVALCEQDFGNGVSALLHPDLVMG